MSVQDGITGIDGCNRIIIPVFNYKFKLFSISLSAVWLVLFVKNVDIPVYCGKDAVFVGWNRILSYSNIVAALSFIMIVIAVYSLLQLSHRFKGSPTFLPVEVMEVQDKNSEYINTLASMVTLFSVIFVPCSTIRDFVVVIIMMTVIVLCFLKTNLYYSNPVCAAFGFRLYTASSTCNSIPSNSIVVYHGILKDGDMVHPYHVSDNVYYLK